jgi:hypothetical protein
MRDVAVEMYLIHNKGLAIALCAHVQRSFVKPGANKKVARLGPGRSGFGVCRFPEELQTGVQPPARLAPPPRLDQPIHLRYQG